MITINKNQEPNELLQYRQQTSTSFDAMDARVKSAVKNSLLEEQGCLCCYCMKRISETNMKVEHWHSQKQYPHEQLYYQNLLAACPGRSEKKYHCDTKKGHDDLKFNPADKNHPIENYVKYSVDGEIQSLDTEFHEQLNTVLNLNADRLKLNRKKVIAAIWKALKKRSGVRTAQNIQNIINEWQSKDENGHLQEYCGVAIYFLNKRLNRSSR